MDVLSLILRDIKLSTFHYWVQDWICHTGPFILLSYIPSLPYVLRAFCIKRCWIVSYFSAFLHLLLMRYITFIDLHVFNHLCIRGINLIRAGCMIYCWISYYSILLKIFTFIFIKEIFRIDSQCGALLPPSPGVELGVVVGGYLA